MEDEDNIVKKNTPKKTKIKQEKIDTTIEEVPTKEVEIPVVIPTQVVVEPEIDIITPIEIEPDTINHVGEIQCPKCYQFFLEQDKLVFIDSMAGLEDIHKCPLCLERIN